MAEVGLATWGYDSRQSLLGDRGGSVTPRSYRSCMNIPVSTTTSTTNPAQLIVSHAFHVAYAEIAIWGLIAITFAAIGAGLRRLVSRRR